MALAFDGCAADPNAHIMHAFEIGIDPSLPYAKNIHYQYGELVVAKKPIAKPIGAPFDTAELEMTIPENFEVSWETPDGASHKAIVPVRGRLKSSIKDKGILFLIFHDEVHGYVVTDSPTGERREQFY